MSAIDGSENLAYVATGPGDNRAGFARSSRDVYVLLKYRRLGRISPGTIWRGGWSNLRDKSEWGWAGIVQKEKWTSPSSEWGCMHGKWNTYNMGNSRKHLSKRGNIQSKKGGNRMK